MGSDWGFNQADLDVGQEGLLLSKGRGWYNRGRRSDCESARMAGAGGGHLLEGGSARLAGPVYGAGAELVARQGVVLTAQFLAGSLERGCWQGMSTFRWAQAELAQSPGAWQGGGASVKVWKFR